MQLVRFDKVWVGRRVEFRFLRRSAYGRVTRPPFRLGIAGLPVAGRLSTRPSRPPPSVNLPPSRSSPPLLGE